MTTTEVKPALKVLFVDNSKTTRFAMSRLLEARGFTVDTATTGQEAIDKIQKDPYDLAIMDLYMPIMNGYEAARIIRSLDHPAKDIPIIALTASQDPKDMDLCKKVGMNEYIVKTEDNKNLFEVLEKYRDKK